jgi:hypothetical protein
MSQQLDTATTAAQYCSCCSRFQSAGTLDTHTLCNALYDALCNALIAAAAVAVDVAAVTVAITAYAAGCIDTDGIGEPVAAAKDTLSSNRAPLS